MLVIKCIYATKTDIAGRKNVEWRIETLARVAAKAYL